MLLLGSLLIPPRLVFNPLVYSLNILVIGTIEKLLMTVLWECTPNAQPSSPKARAIIDTVRNKHTLCRFTQMILKHNNLIV